MLDDGDKALKKAHELCYKKRNDLKLYHICVRAKLSSRERLL